jgi:hypothetical protein
LPDNTVLTSGGHRLFFTPSKLRFIKEIQWHFVNFTWFLMPGKRLQANEADKSHILKDLRSATLLSGILQMYG